ncbi:MAG: hypothetical protein NDJ18_00685 [candidate division Zixibacteria bacterium]|nr:hypothetical protein [candidate division Zixibacteria bacterium]
MSAFTNMVAAITITGFGLLGCDSGPKLTDEQKRGKQIYEGLCDKCHELIPPTRFTDQVWTAASNKYGTKLKLTRDEVSLLADYLTRANDSESKD